MMKLDDKTNLNPYVTRLLIHGCVFKWLRPYQDFVCKTLSFVRARLCKHLEGCVEHIVSFVGHV